MKKIYLVLVVLSSLGLGAMTGYWAGINHGKGMLASALDIIRPIRENDPSYKFINPLLAYIIPSAESQDQFKVLKNSMLRLIDSEKKSGNVTDVSVFLSNLDEGRWIGVNEDQKYTPASMLKVVIMVAYFREKEKEPDILSKTLTYSGDLDQLLRSDIFNAQSQLTVGQSYSVERLINTMIIDSDNGAELLLLGNVKDSYLNGIYNVLGIENPENSSHFTISPRTYSLFFRMLYSATYLRKGNSEKVLDILSQTTFKDGLVVGVPASTTVAHKFGEYVDSQNNKIKSIELHDCGIIYRQGNPYFLCIMTKGNDLDRLKFMVKNISSLVYDNYSNTK